MATSSKEIFLFSGSKEISLKYVTLASVFLTLIAVVAGSTPLKREITVLYNEQCGNHTACNQPDNSTESFNNLVHIIAKGPTDTIHYIWSSMGAPGVVLVRTKNNAKLTVDWDKLSAHEPQALMFLDSDVWYSVAFVFGRLIEYNDTSDKADLSRADSYPINSTFLEDLQWQDSNKTLNHSTHCGDLTSYDAQLGPNATFALKFQAFNKSGRASDLPHLQSTANSSQIELILDHLGTHYKQSRFAIELLVLRHDQNTTEDLTLSLEKSIDDEYTPSVFETYNLKVPSSRQQGSYSQWKPVTYNNVKKAMSNAVQTKNYGVNKTSYFLPKWSIAHAYYPNTSSLYIVGLNVSYGMPKDGFYTASNYSSWTISIGYGKPPEEKISLTIIIVISAGLGIPLILILFGGLYVGVSKKLNQQSEYQSLDDDDTPASPSINS